MEIHLVRGRVYVLKTVSGGCEGDRQVDLIASMGLAREGLFGEEMMALADIWDPLVTLQ